MRGASLYTYLKKKTVTFQSIWAGREVHSGFKQQFREATICLPKLLKIFFKE